MSKIRVSKIRVSKIRVSKIRGSEIRVSKIRGSKIRVSEIRVSEIRISSNHRELHGAIFYHRKKARFLSKLSMAQPSCLPVYLTRTR